MLHCPFQKVTNRGQVYLKLFPKTKVFKDLFALCLVVNSFQITYNGIIGFHCMFYTYSLLLMCVVDIQAQVVKETKDGWDHWINFFTPCLLFLQTYVLRRHCTSQFKTWFKLFIIKISNSCQIGSRSQQVDCCSKIIKF